MTASPITFTSQASRVVARPNGRSPKRVSMVSVDCRSASTPPIAIREVEAKNAVPF